MTFRTTISLAVEYERLKALARHLRSQCIRTRNTDNLNEIVNEFLPLLRSTSAAFGSVPSAMADFAKAQESDPDYDATAAFTAMKAAVDDTLTTLIAGVPKDGDGYVLDRQMDGSGLVTPRLLTAEQKSALNTKLDAIIAAIEA